MIRSGIMNLQLYVYVIGVILTLFFEIDTISYKYTYGPEVWSLSEP
jgi:hypothetical protein